MILHSTRVSLGVASLLVLLPAGFAATINVNPSQNAAKIVAAAPAGSTFSFASGTYSLQEIRPKTGDTFTGPADRSAILDGGQQISFTQISGDSLWSGKIGSMPVDAQKCLTTSPLCDYRRDLFIGSTRLTPVKSKSELSKTTWYYDESTGTAVINFSPGSHPAEIGTADCGFCGYATHVTITNFTVQRYATTSQGGAVGDLAGGSYWTVTNVEGRYNHGAGIVVGPNSTLESNYLHHNGQKGLGAHGANIIIEKNELAYNNLAGFTFGGEAGGAKFGGLNHATITYNNVHDNNGAGLWDDNYSIDVHYANNTVENNAATGIQHELGYAAVIEDNTLTRNGSLPRISMWNGQVSVQNSTNTIVRNNKAIVAADYGSGLVIVNQNRGITKELYGPNTGSNNTVENNDVTYEGKDGAGGIMGIKGTATGNVIDYNTYRIPVGLDKHHFEAFGVKTFNQFQSAGFDDHGKEVWTQ